MTVALSQSSSRRGRREATTGLDGILVVAKPSGPTSHDVVGLVRRLTGVRRVGHGGTLDPFAVGVLPIFLGHATRMVEYHLADTKEYRALVAFGARSTTDDLEGELTPGSGPPPDREAVSLALRGFLGTIDQRPPDYSAVHVAGRRAYELARHGQKPDLKVRRVEIIGLGLVEWDASDPQRPTALIDVRCSAGTYIRALARDLGDQLGCGAYLAALTRTASGPFRLSAAHPLERVRELLAAGRAGELLLPPDTGLDFPTVELPLEELRSLALGRVIRPRAIPSLVATRAPTGGRDAPPPLVRVVDQHRRLAAIARLDAGRLHPEKVFVSPAAL